MARGTLCTGLDLLWGLCRIYSSCSKFSCWLLLTSCRFLWFSTSVQYILLAARCHLGSSSQVPLKVKQLLSVDMNVEGTQQQLCVDCVLWVVVTVVPSLNLFSDNLPRCSLFLQTGSGWMFSRPRDSCCTQLDCTSSCYHRVETKLCRRTD